MIRGTLFYHRNLIFVQFLLFFVMGSHFHNSGVLTSLFLPVSFCPKNTGESETLQYMVVFSRFYENNQDSTHNLFLVYQEKTKVQTCHGS